LQLHADEAQAGSVVACPQCGTRIGVPAPGLDFSAPAPVPRRRPARTSPLVWLLLAACFPVLVCMGIARLGSESSPGTKVIPYTVMKRDEHATIKLLIEVRVDLVDGRLPNEAELLAVAEELHRRERRHDNNFIFFHRPGKHDGTVCFASAHGLPPRVQIFPDDPYKEPLPPALRKEVEAVFKETVVPQAKVAKADLKFEGSYAFVRVYLVKGAGTKDGMAIAAAYYRRVQLDGIQHDVTCWDHAGADVGHAQNEDGGVWWRDAGLGKARVKLK